MRALRQSNIHTGQDILSQAEYDALTVKNATTLYIIGSVSGTDLTVSNLFVGTVAQDILIDNAGAIAWVRDGITGHTNAAVSIANLI